MRWATSEIPGIVGCALACLVVLCGCERDCAFTEDGVCDEPINCPLGTDELDCIEACDSGENLHLFAAACANLDPADEPVDDGDPSGGDLHLTGTQDGLVSVPSGEWLPSNIDRHYTLHVPASYDPGRSHPLVIMMPGHRVSHYDLPSYTELPRAADELGFIVVFAEQQYRWDSEHRWAWWTDWNWDGQADSNPDFDYLREVIDRVSDGYNVDRSRIFLAGHSRGGAMAFIGSLELSDIVAGACIQSGFTEYGYLDDRLSSWDGRKVPMVFIHGIQDPDVGVEYADDMVERIEELGWSEGDDYLYYRMDNVKHRYQPWLNQQWFDYLAARPLGQE